MINSATSRNRSLIVLMFTLMSLVFVMLEGAGCASSRVADGDVGPRLSDGAYRKLFDKHSRDDRQYSGFQNTLEVHATFLNSDIQTAVLQRDADTLLWDSRTAQSEREKIFQQNSNATKFFLSFFVPTPRLNDLAKPNSVWKIYLEANGERYQGKAEKIKRPLEAILASYPTHTRWGQPYEVTFPVPLSVVENYPVKFIITGGIASSILQFDAVESK